MLLTLNPKKIDISELTNPDVSKPEIKEYYAKIPTEFFMNQPQPNLTQIQTVPRANLLDEFVLKKSGLLPNSKKQLKRYKNYRRLKKNKPTLSSLNLICHIANYYQEFSDYLPKIDFNDLENKSTEELAMFLTHLQYLVNIKNQPS